MKFGTDVIYHVRNELEKKDSKFCPEMMTSLIISPNLCEKWVKYARKKSKLKYEQT